MINKLLTAFNRNNFENNADFGEKIGNIGLGLLSIGFGKTLIIEKISEGADQTAFTRKAYSASARVAAVALFIFALPVTIILAGIGCIGRTFSKSHQQIFNSYNQSKLVPIGKRADSIEDLWSLLQIKTQAQLSEIEFAKNLNHRLFNVHCPKATAFEIGGKYLHANKVGEGIAQRCFVASQAPLEEDYEIFWKAIFEVDATIFDLTTIADQKTGGVTKYYPETLDEIMKYGSMSVKLIKITDGTSTYQIENVATGAVKNINRFHYADWKDFGTVSMPTLNLLVRKIETLSPNPKNLVWIHCRAGVGRTGTLITALILKEKIKSGELNKENLDASLVDIIVELRKQRGPLFVQQKAQLDLLRQYADSLLKS